MDPGGGGGVYGFAIMCCTTLGSCGGGRDSKGEIGGGDCTTRPDDCPTKSIIGGLILDYCSPICIQ